MLNTAMIAILATTLMITPAPPVKEAGVSAVPREHFTLSKKEVLGQKFLDLSNRYPDAFVNEVFSDNIILNLHFIKGDVDSIKTAESRFGLVNIDWEKARAPFLLSFNITSGQTFVFHDSLLPQFKDKDVKIGGSHYSIAEGYKSDGYLAGDGVCHLASLFNWAAREAGLDVLTKVNHDFATIADVPKEFGVSIYSIPNSGYTSEAQNLYITNTFSFPVTFMIKVENGLVGITITR